MHAIHCKSWRFNASLRSSQGRNGGTVCLVSRLTAHPTAHTGTPKSHGFNSTRFRGRLAPRALGPKSETHGLSQAIGNVSVSCIRFLNMYLFITQLCWGLVWVRTHSEEQRCAGTPVLSLILQVSPTQHRRPLINTFPFFLQGGFLVRENRPIA